MIWDEEFKNAVRARYDVVGVVGEGATSRVFRARSRKTGEDTAIKVLRPRVAMRLAKERFQREMQIVTRVHHPALAPVLECGREGDFLFIVMPFFEDGSLQERLQAGPLSEEFAVDVAVRIASGVQHMHDAGYVHRDIKPANILFAGANPVLVDFGVARARDVARDLRITDPGEAVGTPTYMSPEQAMGKSLLEPACDQYSLACVLYECLSGQPPFTPSSPNSTIVRKMDEPVPDISHTRPDVGLRTRDALRRALEWRPRDRFPNIKTFAAALEI